MKAKLVKKLPYIDAEVKSYQDGRKLFNDMAGGYFLAPNHWRLPRTVASIMLLKNLKYSLNKPLIKWYKSKLPSKISKIKKIPKLKGKPFKFQMRGIEHIEANKGIALIADEMGLGKTVQALSWTQLHRKKKPVLIICPSSLKLNWSTEIVKWLGNKKKIEILSGRKTYPIINPEYVIINYDILVYWITRLSHSNFKIMIMDESHYIKSNAAKRTKATKAIAKNIPYKIALTGTPIENRPVEMYNMLSILDKDIFPNYFSFTKRYCAAKHGRFGWDVSGSSNTDELHKVLNKTLMIRRKKSDVLKELPNKIHSSVILEIDNDAEYRHAEKDIINYILEEKGKAKAERAKMAQTLVSIETLKQLSVKGKMKQVLEWIAVFLASGEKLVVFTTHKEPIDIITKTFTSAVKIDGSVSINNREKAVNSFQNDPKVNLIVGNIKAMGVGLTLTAASNVAFIELGWTSTVHQQAEDRCHRIGQKDTVNVYYLLAKNTIEEKILELLNEKSKIIEQVIDGKATNETSVLKALLTSLVQIN